LKNLVSFQVLVFLLSCICLWACKTQDVEAPIPLPVGSRPGVLVINEVLYDPSNLELTGDSNGDSLFSTSQDEFIEFVNNGDSAIDMSGYTISDFVIADLTSTVRFTFPSNTNLAGGKSFVVFGGGTPTGSFGGAQIFVSENSGGLSFGNSGEKIVIKDSTGKIIYVFDSDALSNNPDESYTRNPDFSGVFVQHGSVVAGRLFSPGANVNGNPF
jgi:hypothetical protein